MLTGLTIQGIVPFGEEDGDMKIDAIKCILTHLNEGIRASGKHLLDLRITIDTVTPDNVLFHVEYGFGEPARFYYNKPDQSEVPGYISIKRRGPKFNPILFVSTIHILLTIEVQSSA